MPYNVSFISLGCAKNQVNCEQMMATVQHAGHNIVLSPEGADVAVVNTCGFLASACEEAIDNILEMAELKKEGKLKKIIVTGCMAQRYKDDVLHELPEVDAVLGTGSYGEIARAVDEVMAPGGLRPCYMGDIQNCVQGGARICPRRRGMRICASPRAATTAVPTASFRACAAVTAAVR